MPQKSLIHNILFKGLLNIFNILLPMIIIPYVYRILGPSQIGNIEFANTLLAYFTMLGMLGIYNYGLREISANRNNLSKMQYIYKNLFTIGLISNTIALVAFVIFIIYFVSDPAVKAISFILCGNIISQYLYVEWMNEALEEFSFITIKTIIIRLISILFMLIFIKESQDSLNYVIILTITAIINYLASFIYSANKIKLPLRQLFSGLNLKSFVLPLLIIFLLNNTSVLFTLADKTILGFATDNENVAYFGLAQRITEMIRTLLLSLIFATLPRLSLYLKENRSLYQSGIIKLIQFMLVLAIPMGIGLCLLSKEVILIFGGEEFLGAVPVMQIFSIRVILMSIEAIFYNQIIFLHGKEKILILFSLICGGINILLNFIFIHKLTPEISICCTLVSEIIFESLCFIYIKLKLNLQLELFSKKILNYLIFSLLFIPIVIALRYLNMTYIPFILISIILCCTTYMGLLIFTNDSSLIEMKEFMSKFFNRKK